MRRRWIVVPLALVLGAAVAGCTDDDDDPGPARPSSTGAVPKVNLTFGVWGTEHGDRRLPGRRRHLQRHQRRGHGQDQGLRHPRRPDRGARQRRGARRLPGQPRRPRRPAGAEAQPADRRPARRARRRLRRRLLAAGARGVRQRPRAAVHALRHLADGHLLQQRARRLRGDGRARPRRPHRRRRGPRQEADLDPRAVPDRGGLRQPPAPRHRRLLRRADAARAGAVHLLRRRQDLRQRRRADLAGLLLRRHPVGPREGAAAAARPEADADAGEAVREDAARVVP